MKRFCRRLVRRLMEPGGQKAETFERSCVPASRSGLRNDEALNPEIQFQLSHFCQRIQGQRVAQIPISQECNNYLCFAARSSDSVKKFFVRHETIHECSDFFGE